jgi:Protein of unknown function (DUF3558)
MRSRLVAAAVIVSTFIAACSPDTSGFPPPRTPTSRTTSTTPSTPTTTVTSEQRRPTNAPPVTRPLDLVSFRQRPCDLLTREQQALLDLPQPTSVGALCRWTRDQPKVSVSVDLMIDLSYMQQVYLQSNLEDSGGEKEWVVFDPITVGGQPAVVLNATTQKTASGVLVATSSHDSVDITVTIETGADPRATAISIAEQIVGNLKPAK